MFFRKSSVTGHSGGRHGSRKHDPRGPQEVARRSGSRREAGQVQRHVQSLRREGPLEPRLSCSRTSRGSWRPRGSRRPRGSWRPRGSQTRQARGHRRIQGVQRRREVSSSPRYAQSTSPDLGCPYSQDSPDPLSPLSRRVGNSRRLPRATRGHAPPATTPTTSGARRSTPTTSATRGPRRSETSRTSARFELMRNISVRRSRKQRPSGVGGNARSRARPRRKRRRR